MFIVDLWEESPMNRYLKLATVVALSLSIAACARNEAATPPAQAPQVSVAKVISHSVAEFDQFTGRIQPVERVEIRPRVTGYIASVNFVEGREVKHGDVLFVIDPRPYEADLKRAQADLARTRTAATLARTEHERATKLLNLHAISQEEFDTRVAGSEQAVANVQAAEAAVDAAQLNLTFTTVRAPISGLISRAEVTSGNLVTSGQSLLTTVVSVDPVYVEFQADERMFLKYAAGTRRDATIAKSAQSVWVGLANEDGYPHEGKMVFLDNQLDAATGTVRARGKLDNHDRVYTPGMFARIRLSDNERQEAVLVKDTAVGTDQSARYVLVVNAQNQVEYRAVTLGPIVHEQGVEGLRVIRDGLQVGETIVVNGLQRVRPGATVTPTQVAMVNGVDNGAALASNAQTKASTKL
jgi:RND family efflux transporter MFP subunit